MIWRQLLYLRFAATIVATLAVTKPLTAQETPSSRVLFAYDRQAALEAPEQTADRVPSQALAAEHHPPAKSNEHEALHPAPLPSDVVRPDAALEIASHVTEPEGTLSLDRRRLQPPSAELAELKKPDAREKFPLPVTLPKMDSLGTAGTGLALVLGLFLLCVSFVRKTKPNSSSPLPVEAVAVLGRVPLTGRHMGQLIQVGTKLVLVAATQDSLQTITEVTDPTEVERLLALCMRANPRSTSAEFQRMLKQMSKEPARGFLGG